MLGSTMVGIKQSRPELLVSGYIREHEDNLQLYMVVPNGIIQHITKFYPSVIGFGLHHKAHFIVSENGIILRGDNEHTCSGYMIYAETSEQDKNGYNNGIHTWSILSLSSRSSACYQSIGVTTRKPSQIWFETRTSHWPSNTDMISHNDNKILKTDSYYSGYNEKWEQNEIISVKLNCNNWTVTFYKGIHQLRKDNIRNNRSYFLALSCCAAKNIVHLKSVEFPGDKQHLMHM
eukprot:85469_1